MSMNPKSTTDKIRNEYKDYISSILTVKDPQITKLAHEEVKKTAFVKGPYLETTLPFEDGKSLEDLVKEGLISKEFEIMGDSVHYSDWKLRIHQEKALRKIITENRNMVISTGTGSGKTECYLYPIFNSLMREKEAGTLDSGVRALLIFPMNALANDQQKKLRVLLKDYPDITFGRYTGETAHKQKNETSTEAENRLHSEYDEIHMSDTEEALRKSIPNELMCREYMAENPPHILLTNYAMLEYMLLRPDTAPFFDNESAKNWRFIVIDEAHTYKGANGTEIALLLRRLKERISRNMEMPFRCIATSATLGDEKAKGDLAKFAENLFGEEFTEDDIITTRRKTRGLPSNGHAYSLEEYESIKERAIKLSETERGAFLYNVLKDDLRLFDLYRALNTKPKRIQDVASYIFDDISDVSLQEYGLIILIELAAAAKKSEFESALLPARYHLFVKSLEGMFVQYYPRKKVFLDRIESNNEDGCNSVFELANCQKCGQEYLVGKTQELHNQNYFVQTSSEDKPEYYFMSDNGIDGLSEFDEDDSVEETSRLDELEKYHLCTSCGRIVPFAEKFPVNCCDVEDCRKIVTVFHLKYKGKSNESNCCPCCGSTKKGLIKRFLTANQPATFAIAKSLYDAIPPRPVKYDDSNDDLFDDDIFDDDLFADEIEAAPVSKDIQDESGRKLLIFSDNRQEAAFFAGFFDKKYNLLMWRKAILACLRNAENKELLVDDLIRRLMNFADKQGLYSFDDDNDRYLTDDQKYIIAAHYVMQEFLQPDLATSLEGLGFIDIEPIPARLKESVEIDGLKGTALWNFMRYSMDTLRKKGAVSYPDNIRATDEFFEPRNHTAFFKLQGANVGEHVFGFIPAEKSKNKRLSLMMKLIDEPNKEECEKRARADLKGIYEILINLGNKRHYLVDTQDNSKGMIRQLDYRKWKFKYIDEQDVLYRCNKCGKVFSYSINDCCPMMKCDGTLERTTAKEIRENNYYQRVFNDEKLIPMIAREHTAQLSPQTAGKYQKQFEEGKINVLSCSTTFEMGVDVGELEATFQRNVPPETSNYIQRAGRAGRRTSSAAFSVTFSRRNSHDMAFFQDPPSIISGKIPAPILEINNEKIAERHLNSIIVSWFFKKRPEFFYENTKRIVSLDGHDNMVKALRKYLDEKPMDLLNNIHAALPQEICEKLGVDEWKFISGLIGKDGTLTKAIDNRAADIKGLQALYNEDKETDKLMKAKGIERLISTIEQEPSINFLSANGILPKYGFPIDSVSLDILGNNDATAKAIDLSRDLRMAISEFAPPTEIVANGKIWQSYALNIVPNKSWPAYIYYECPRCKKIYPPITGMVEPTSETENAEDKVCELCHTKMKAKKFIKPIFGFSSKMNEKGKQIGEARPSTYYSTQTQFWGIDTLTEKQQAEAKERKVSIGGKTIEITYSPGGKLFILNQGKKGRGLSICPKCGYACDPTSTILKKGNHNTKFDRKCSNTYMIHASLGHDFSTDILKIKLPNHDVKLGNKENVIIKNKELSILYALLEGASLSLGINRSDINGCVVNNNELVLYDDTPGGSGYVKHIYNKFEDVIRTALKKVNGACGCTEETSCYGCLRNYTNQFYHDEISRGLAKHYLLWLLNTRTKQTDDTQSDSIVNTVNNDDVKQGIKVSNYNPEDTSENDDTLTILHDMYNNCEVEEVKEGIENLVMLADDNYEHPVTDNYIQVEQNIWPELFWGKSHVALFTPGQEKQMKILKKYDWYCYMLDENINAEYVFSHVLKEQ